MQVKCNKCGYVGDESEFPKGRDFFQFEYIRRCPKACGNEQTPGGASMRMAGGERPFSFVREGEPKTDPVATVIHRSKEAS